MISIVDIAGGTVTISSLRLVGANGLEYWGNDGGSCFFDNVVAETGAGGFALSVAENSIGRSLDLYLQRWQNVAGSSPVGYFHSAVMDIWGSRIGTVSIVQTAVTGADGRASDGSHNALAGQTGIQVKHTEGEAQLFVARVSAAGGRGGDGSHDPSGCLAFFAWRGGDGIHTHRVASRIAGSSSDAFQGGDGGDGHVSIPCADTSAGGDDGHGLSETSGNPLEYAGITTGGGHGGSGDPPGRDGSGAWATRSRYRRSPRSRSRKTS